MNAQDAGLIGLVIVLVFVAAFWLLFRNHPGERMSALQSTLVLTCMLFVLRFIGLILHEGGHALYLLLSGYPATLYVHPFDFSGYARPMGNFDVWTHLSGSALAISASLLISLPFWKRRSLSALPFLMLFPWVAFNDGMYMLQRQGDYRNLLEVTGLPDIVFICVGGIIAIVGLTLLLSLLPLLGLSPRGVKALLVVPSAMLLWGLSSMLLARLLVPGSWIDVEYSLAPEITRGASDNYFEGIMGLILAAVYLTLYRLARPRLPSGLRMETINLNWRDLRLPALLFGTSVILGLVIIL